MNERCPFCRRDPYEYVDIGVGMARVAVSCCDYGIGLIQYGDKTLQKILNLRRSYSPRKRARARRMLAALPY